MEKYVSICPNCGRIYKHTVDKTQPCFERSCISVETVFSGYTEPEWESLSDAAKNAKSDEIKCTAKPPITNEKSSANVTESNTWISLLDTIADIDIFLGILGSIIGGASLFDLSIMLGLAVIVLGSVLTLIVAASVKVFLGVAKDIHYLRKAEEKRQKTE